MKHETGKTRGIRTLLIALLTYPVVTLAFPGATGPGGDAVRCPGEVSGHVPASGSLRVQMMLGGQDVISISKSQRVMQAIIEAFKSEGADNETIAAAFAYNLVERGFMTEEMREQYSDFVIVDAVMETMKGVLQESLPESAQEIYGMVRERAIELLGKKMLRTDRITNPEEKSIAQTKLRYEVLYFLLDGLGVIVYPGMGADVSPLYAASYLHAFNFDQRSSRAEEAVARKFRIIGQWPFSVGYVSGFDLFNDLEDPRFGGMLAGCKTVLFKGFTRHVHPRRFAPGETLDTHRRAFAQKVTDEIGAGSYLVFFDADAGADGIIQYFLDTDQYEAVELPPGVREDLESVEPGKPTATVPGPEVMIGTRTFTALQRKPKPETAQPAPVWRAWEPAAPVRMTARERLAEALEEGLNSAGFYAEGNRTITVQPETLEITITIEAEASLDDITGVDAPLITAVDVLGELGVPGRLVDRNLYRFERRHGRDVLTIDMAEVMRLSTIRDTIIDTWLELLAAEAATLEEAVGMLRQNMEFLEGKGIPLAAIGTIHPPFGSAIEYLDEGITKMMVVRETPEGLSIERHGENTPDGRVLHARMTVIPEILGTLRGKAEGLADVWREALTELFGATTEEGPAAAFPVESDDFRHMRRVLMMDLPRVGDSLPPVTFLEPRTQARIDAISGQILVGELAPYGTRRYINILIPAFQLWEAEKRQRVRDRLEAVAEELLAQHVFDDVDDPYLLEQRFASLDPVRALFAQHGLDADDPLYRLWAAREYCRQRMLTENIQLEMGRFLEDGPAPVFTPEQFPRGYEIWRQYIQEPADFPDRELYQVTRQGETVGLMLVEFLEGEMSVLRLEVAKNYQRMGIGSLLIQRAAALNREEGFPGEFFVLPTAAILDGGEAVEFYTRLGFQEDERDGRMVMICSPERARELQRELTASIAVGDVRVRDPLAAFLAPSPVYERLAEAL